MLNLKVVFFLFLSIKIILIKFLKKIYFSTDLYNKSLISILPKQIYFYPNSFLLSSLVTHKNFSIKIKDINTKNFWKQKYSASEKELLHNFFWLNLIDRKNDANIIQEIITNWMYENKKYKKTVWQNSILSRRLISWILNADIILKNTDQVFKNNFFQSIIIQINHLKKNIKFESNYSKIIESLTAISLSGLVFREYKENFNFAEKELQKLIENFFDTDGFPLNRNPNDLIKFSKYFIIIKECSKDAHQLIPDYLDEIIEKNLCCLYSLVDKNSEIPLFNGATENRLEDFQSYIQSLNYNVKKLKDFVGKIRILKYKKQILFFDIGEPPHKKFSSNYQSGPLSFEYWIDHNKIITNCGYGSQISKKGELLSRLTSAHSTISINDTSVVKFERNNLINKVYGNSIKNEFKILDPVYENNETTLCASASHNAYLNEFGCIHKRIICFNKNDDVFEGTDVLVKKKDTGKKTLFHSRFHLYPGLTAVETIGKKSILIQINKNKSLIFTCSENKIFVEKSIFLGRNQIFNNFCITIQGHFDDKKEIKWSIKKKD